jgi:hypothetical protein
VVVWLCVVVLVSSQLFLAFTFDSFLVLFVVCLFAGSCYLWYAYMSVEASTSSAPSPTAAHRRFRPAPSTSPSFLVTVCDEAADTSIPNSSNGGVFCDGVDGPDTPWTRSDSARDVCEGIRLGGKRGTLAFHSISGNVSDASAECPAPPSTPANEVGRHRDDRFGKRNVLPLMVPISEGARCDTAKEACFPLDLSARPRGGTTTALDDRHQSSRCDWDTAISNSSSSSANAAISLWSSLNGAESTLVHPTPHSHATTPSAATSFPATPTTDAVPDHRRCRVRYGGEQQLQQRSFQSRVANTVEATVLRLVPPAQASPSGLASEEGGGTAQQQRSEPTSAVAVVSSPAWVAAAHEPAFRSSSNTANESVHGLPREAVGSSRTTPLAGVSHTRARPTTTTSTTRTLARRPAPLQVHVLDPTSTAETLPGRNNNGTSHRSLGDHSPWGSAASTQQQQQQQSPQHLNSGPPSEATVSPSPRSSMRSSVQRTPTAATSAFSAASAQQVSTPANSKGNHSGPRVTPNQLAYAAVLSMTKPSVASRDGQLPPRTHERCSSTSSSGSGSAPVTPACVAHSRHVRSAESRYLSMEAGHDVSCVHRVSANTRSRGGDVPHTKTRFQDTWFMVALNFFVGLTVPHLFVWWATPRVLPAPAASVEAEAATQPSLSLFFLTCHHPEVGLYLVELVMGMVCVWGVVRQCHWRSPASRQAADSLDSHQRWILQPLLDLPAVEAGRATRAPVVSAPVTPTERFATHKSGGDEAATETAGGGAVLHRHHSTGFFATVSAPPSLSLSLPPCDDDATTAAAPRKSPRKAGLVRDFTSRLPVVSYVSASLVLERSLSSLWSSSASRAKETAGRTHHCSNESDAVTEEGWCSGNQGCRAEGLGRAVGDTSYVTPPVPLQPQRAPAAAVARHVKPSFAPMALSLGFVIATGLSTWRLSVDFYFAWFNFQFDTNAAFWYWLVPSSLTAVLAFLLLFIGGHAHRHQLACVLQSTKGNGRGDDDDHNDHDGITTAAAVAAMESCTSRNRALRRAAAASLRALRWVSWCGCCVPHPFPEVVVAPSLRLHSIPASSVAAVRNVFGRTITPDSTTLRHQHHLTRDRSTRGVTSPAASPGVVKRRDLLTSRSHSTYEAAVDGHRAVFAVDLAHPPEQSNNNSATGSCVRDFNGCPSCSDRRSKNDFEEDEESWCAVPLRRSSREALQVPTSEPTAIDNSNNAEVKNAASCGCSSSSNSYENRVFSCHNRGSLPDSAFSERETVVAVTEWLTHDGYPRRTTPWLPTSAVAAAAAATAVAPTTPVPPLSGTLYEDAVTSSSVLTSAMERQVAAAASSSVASTVRFCHTPLCDPHHHDDNNNSSSSSNQLLISTHPHPSTLATPIPPATLAVGRRTQRRRWRPLAAAPSLFHALAYYRDKLHLPDFFMRLRRVCSRHLRCQVWWESCPTQRGGPANGRAGLCVGAASLDTSSCPNEAASSSSFAVALLMCDVAWMSRRGRWLSVLYLLLLISFANVLTALMYFTWQWRLIISRAASSSMFAVDVAAARARATGSFPSAAAYTCSKGQQILRSIAWGVPPVCVSGSDAAQTWTTSNQVALLLTMLGKRHFEVAYMYVSVALPFGFLCVVYHLMQELRLYRRGGNDGSRFCFSRLKTRPESKSKGREIMV